MIVPLTIYLLERLVRLVLSHVRNTELIDVKLMGGNDKVRRPVTFTAVGVGISTAPLQPATARWPRTAKCVSSTQVRDAAGTCLSSPDTGLDCAGHRAAHGEATQLQDDTRHVHLLEPARRSQIWCADVPLRMYALQPAPTTQARMPIAWCRSVRLADQLLSW